MNRDLSRRAWLGVYAGVGLTTLATLVVELALTRIFSVVFYYHFAFLAISIALFGLGAGGVLSYAVSRRGMSLFRRLGWFAAATSVLAAAALAFLLTRRDPGYVTLGLVYFTSALPFVGAGTVISLAISETIQRVNRVYFADLLGASAGCLLLVPLLNRLGGPNTVFAAAGFYAISAVLWFALARQRRALVAAAALSVAVFTLVAANRAGAILDVRYAKGRELAGERFVKWNSFSRVALGEEKESGQPNIVIDADAATGIPNFDFAHLTGAQRNELLHMGPGLPYVVRPGAKTLVIGAGGGWDIARALASRSRDVTGVEINPIIATTIMRERFPALSGGLYFRPEVRIAVEDGRGFIRRTHEKYDVIQATLVDTWAATAAGAFALSENNLYTTEAFQEYLEHLNGDGVIAFTRWGFEPPRESLRVVSLARAALARLGLRDAWRRVVVMREGRPEQLSGWGNVDTVLIAREPFSADDLGRLRQAASAGGIQTLYMPDAPVTNVFGEFLRSADPEAFARDYRYDISPVYDNRPFFFYTVQPRDIWAFLTSASRLSADYNVNRALPLLFALLAVSALATAVVLMLPRVLLGSRLPRDRRALKFLWYFICIGMGYILIQVALVQKFVLFLGHPTYALTGIIFSMLLSSGLGSYASAYLVRARDRRLAVVLVSVALLVAALAGAVALLLDAGAGLPLRVKFLLSVLVIAPAGFLMGVPFPSGLHRLEGLHSESVRWAWSLNAAASVLGSVAAIVLGIYIGLVQTLLAGGLMYLLALLSLLWSAPLVRPQTAESPAPAVTTV